MVDNVPRLATGSVGAPTAAVSTSANAGDGSGNDSLGARGDLAISAVVTEQSGLVDVPLGGQPTAEGQEQPVQPAAPPVIAMALTLGAVSTEVHLARGGELGDARPGGHLRARVEKLRRDLAGRPVAGWSASELWPPSVGEPLTETVSLRSRGAEAMDTGVGGDTPMDVDAPKLMKDMIEAQLEEVVEYVKKKGGTFAKHYDNGENFRKARFEVNWAEGLPPEGLASEELLETLTSCSLEMLRRKLEQTDASSSSPPRNCEGRADFEGVESGVEGASSGFDEQGAVDEELLKAVAAACAVLTFALISGRDGVVVTLWINGGWLKLHGGHCAAPGPFLALKPRDISEKLACPSQTTRITTSSSRSRRARASSRRSSSRASTSSACPCSGSSTPRRAASGARRCPSPGAPARARRLNFARVVPRAFFGSRCFYVRYFRELAALCAFTLDPAEAERLCANLRHMVYNPDEEGTGSSVYEHDEVLQKYASRVAGGKLQSLLDVFKAPAFGACHDAGAGKKNRNGERRNSKSHAIHEKHGKFYIYERSTDFDIAYFDSHAKAAGLVFVLDSPILDVYFRRAVAHLDGFLARCLGEFVREAAPLRAFCAKLDLGDFATWAKGASMMEAAATPVLYFEDEVDPAYMRDTIALALNQGLRGDYALLRRFQSLDYNFRNGDNIALARWLDVFEDVRDDLEKLDASISWSPRGPA